MADDCIFCEIASGEGPAAILDEDDATVSFLDINPWTRGHSLVIPRAHSTDLLEIGDDDLAATASAAKRLAARLKEELNADGINLVNSCGAAAWQSVFHFHIHVIPRYEGDPMQLPVRPQQADPEVLGARRGAAPVSAARFEQQGDVGVVVLDHPPLNLFGEELGRDLVAAIEEAEQAPIRALLVRAEGDVFTGGADVNVFDDKTPEQAGEFFDQLIGMVHRLEEMSLPTLASVHGLCLTAGFELALGCDMIWASESAQFGLVEIVVGLTPGMGGTQRVAERAGPARARELVMSGGLYPAETLERWNVINRVLPDADLADKSLAFAERLASGPTVANAATKRMVRAYLDEGVRGADARINEISAGLFATEDLKRAVKSFLEDGPGNATFEGR